MGALARLKQRMSRAIVNSAIGSSRELQEFLDQRGMETETGVDVTPDTAMRLAAVYACVRVLSEDIAKLPLIVYRREANGKGRAPDHWLNRLLEQPNPWQTGFEFREMQQAHLELNGNFYAIKTVVGHETRELLPVPPSRMAVNALPNWTLEYRLSMPDGTSQVIPTALVYHVRGLSLNGYTGLSPVSYQRETLGFSIALRRYGSHLFKNGANIGGVFEHPGPAPLSEPAAKRLRESLQESYGGLSNAHKAVLLEEGLKYNKTGMSADDAQFLESRKYSRSEICGFYRVPPHMIADLERATFSNVAQQSLDYVINGLLGRVKRLESRMMVSLLSPVERQTIFLEHLLDGLLRGDFTTRMQGYQIGILTGFYNRNEVRALENLNPGPPELDEFLTPLNMSPADMLRALSSGNADTATPPQPTTNPSARLHAI